MRLSVLASSSSGNGYLLHNKGEALILECGVRFSTVKKALDFNTRIINGALVSHSHGDHSKYLKSYLDAGITVLSNESVFEGQDAKYAIRPDKNARTTKTAAPV